MSNFLINLKGAIIFMAHKARERASINEARKELKRAKKEVKRAIDFFDLQEAKEQEELALKKVKILNNKGKLVYASVIQRKEEI